MCVYVYMYLCVSSLERGVGAYEVPRMFCKASNPSSHYHNLLNYIHQLVLFDEVSQDIRTGCSLYYCCNICSFLAFQKGFLVGVFINSRKGRLVMTSSMTYTMWQRHK